MRGITITIIASMLGGTAPATLGQARGNYPDDALHAWFDKLKSGKGLCCSFADGRTVADPDWDTQDGHYRVRVDGQWIVVPDDAVVNVPNIFGQAVVWPYPEYSSSDNKTTIRIRCFMPGTQG